MKITHEQLNEMSERLKKESGADHVAIFLEDTTTKQVEAVMDVPEHLRTGFFVSAMKATPGVNMVNAQIPKEQMPVITSCWLLICPHCNDLYSVPHPSKDRDKDVVACFQSKAEAEHMAGVIGAKKIVKGNIVWERSKIISVEVKKEDGIPSPFTGIL